jgi:two-component system, NtrC family, response regulator AtoC
MACPFCGARRALPRHTLAEVERAYIEYVWRECAGNHSQAARILGINRVTLYNRLRRYGLKTRAER